MHAPSNHSSDQYVRYQATTFHPWTAFTALGRLTEKRLRCTHRVPPPLPVGGRPHVNGAINGAAGAGFTGQMKQIFQTRIITAARGPLVWCLLPPPRKLWDVPLGYDVTLGT